jgi:hypothetical protein
VPRIPSTAVSGGASLAYTRGAEHAAEHDRDSFGVIPMEHHRNFLAAPKPAVIAKCSAISFNYKQ